MKRYQRAVAVLAAAVLAGAGVTVATTTAASAAQLGTLTFTNFSLGLSSAPTSTSSGRCPTGTQSLAVLLTGGNVPAGQPDPVVATGNNTSQVAANPITLGFDNTLRDIGNLYAVPFNFAPAAGAPPATYTATLGCYNNLSAFGAPTDTFVGQFTVSSAGAFAPVAPVVAPIGTTIKPLTASPSTTATTTDTVAFTADVDAANGSAPVGTVQFTRGGANIGTATAVNASGIATFSGTLPAGTGAIVANFVGTAPYTNSASAPLPYSVTAVSVPPTPTTSTLSVNPLTGPSFQQVTLSGTVAPATGTASPAGTCAFKSGTRPLAAVPVAAGACSFQTTTLSGSPALTFDFIPTDPALFAASLSNTVTPTYVPPVLAGPLEDEQTIIVNVPVGNLSIFTPYTPTSPLNLGLMTLNASGTAFSAGMPFDKVTVIDTRASDPGWTASLAGANFVNNVTPTDVIPVGKSSFTNVTPGYITGNGIQAGDVTVTNLTALTTTPQAFARTTAGNGTGTVYVTADFKLSDVSTSTKSGDYTATVVFTVS